MHLSMVSSMDPIYSPQTLMKISPTRVWVVDRMNEKTASLLLFPDQWSREKSLVTGTRLLDPTAMRFHIEMPVVEKSSVCFPNRGKWSRDAS